MSLGPAGKRRTRVTVEEPTETNTSGNVVLTWSTYCKRWMHVEPLRARECWQAAQVQADVTHRVRCIHDEKTGAITAKMRLRIGSRALHILGPPRNVEERDREIEMFCRETE